MGWRNTIVEALCVLRDYFWRDARETIEPLT
jgi:hypothetical protein